MENTTYITETETRTSTVTLVLGGRGKTGRRIVQQLENRGHSVRVGSRSGTPAFDWNDHSNWDAVLDGVDAIYIAYYPDLAVPGASENIQALVDLSNLKKVSKLVLLSGRGETEAQLCERIVQTSGIPYTIVRCSWFNQNFSENFIRDMVMGGQITLPTRDIQEPFVDADDIADVAVAALSEEGHDGQLYELTGPELLSFSEVASTLSQAIGREISYQSIPHGDFMAGMEAAELPEELTKLIDYLFSTVLDGRNAYLTDGVQRALGREPKNFASYAKETAAAGYWDA